MGHLMSGYGPLAGDFLQRIFAVFQQYRKVAFSFVDRYSINHPYTLVEYDARSVPPFRRGGAR
jgi:hypothetical protein